MKYCSACGSAVEISIPTGDNRPRHICVECETIHYQNPKIVAGCLPVRDNSVLLCKRAIDPQYGLWTLPAGFMENGETLEEAAMRESVEEANASLESLRLYTVISLPHINQVYMMFLADLTDTDYSAGEESLDVALFEEKDIPWDQIAFKTITYTLQSYFSDRKSGLFPLHTSIITKRNR